MLIGKRVASSRVRPQWRPSNEWPVSQDRTKDRSRATGRKWRSLPLSLALCLLVILLVVRLEQLDFMALRNTTTLPMLKLIARSGRAESAAIDNPAGEAFFYLPVAQGIAGTQARALSLLAAAEGDSAEAERWLQAGISDEATADLTHFELCRHHWAQGEDEQAAEACAAVPDSAAYWFNRGLEAMTAADQQQAIRAFELTVRIDPHAQAGQAWLHLADLRLEQGRYEEAIIAYDQVLTFGAASVSVYSRLGQAYLALEQFDLARDMLNQGLALYPNERELYREIANTYRVEGDLTAADGWYVRLLQRWSFDAFAWAARGEIALQNGEPRTALNYYREAVTYNPNGIGYWLGLATSAAAAGNKETAADAYEQTLALKPQDVTIWLRAGEFFIAEGQPEQARLAFEGALALQPENKEAATQLAALGGG